ncbi:response regulator transcription factor [Ruminococcus albus]|uniref:Stage 0 sporulation protein A homolog n=1 Tax=Ruminococcus albus TaxID=1264 RepID=A0A1I1MUK0_RUMAL|nr:response regulator transcription factor [Ruminococcus albus]SFC89039.1 DNA-binding response regulator, OmpR family, contains REC and winged-helix (wHTH) domain [Ruminococcus albus]
MKILIIEDERTLADSLKLMLTSKGFESEAVYDGESGEEYAMLGIYDLIILDIMLPFRNGYQVAKDIRKKHISVPILMLTARSEIEDKVRGLDSGADYYLTKPFDSRELLATVNALLRRQGTQVNELVFGNTHLDLESAELACDDNSVSLSAREFEVMRLLMVSGKNHISKESLLTKVWGYDSNAVENHVEVYVGFLRKKLSSIGSDIHIEAVRRLGYHLECDG